MPPARSAPACSPPWPPGKRRYFTASQRRELFQAIRRDAETRHRPIRALADDYGIHRRVVRQALASPSPRPRKPPRPRPSRLDPYTGIIDAIPGEELRHPGRPAHTIRQILNHHPESPDHRAQRDRNLLRNGSPARRGPAQLAATTPPGSCRLSDAASGHGREPARIPGHQATRQSNGTTCSSSGKSWTQATTSKTRPKTD